MAAAFKARDGWRIEPPLDDEPAGLAGAGIEGLREVAARNDRLIDGCLEVEAMVDIAEECHQGPLILLVATRRADGETGLTVLGD
jgi:hypothetical protein